MICRNCLRRASALRIKSPVTRSFTVSAAPRIAATINPASPSAIEVTANSPEPQFTTPLSNLASKSKSKSANLPVSLAPAGSILKGLNFIKGRDDPVALPEEEYPEWLWHCLDAKKTEGADDIGAGDEFSKSKKQRREAAKRKRKLELRLIAEGNTEALAPKVPLHKQSIDLPFNEQGTVEGGLDVMEKLGEVKEAMRRDRRSKIKEDNFLKGM